MESARPRAVRRDAARGRAGSTVPDSSAFLPARGRVCESERGD
jgi:hypothetical protein